MGFGMKRTVKKSSHTYNAHGSISWLPVDSRLFSQFFSFGHVKGFARLFLEVEIGLSILIVFGTVLYLILKVIGVII